VDGNTKLDFSDPWHVLLCHPDLASHLGHMGIAGRTNTDSSQELGTRFYRRNK
jgi:hypothetical protein